MLVWYVIQVINGREDVMRERIERMVPADAMQELFYPQYQTEIKVQGEWVSTTKPLFPGYLICDTADPRTVQQYLLRMDDFARVLSQDGQFVPLAKEEVQLIGGFTHRGDRVVPMSEALKDGDQVWVGSASKSSASLKVGWYRLTPIPPHFCLTLMNSLLSSEATVSND